MHKYIHAKIVCLFRKNLGDNNWINYLSIVAFGPFQNSILFVPFEKNYFQSTTFLLFILRMVIKHIYLGKVETNLLQRVRKIVRKNRVFIRTWIMKQKYWRYVCIPDCWKKQPRSNGYPREERLSA